MNASGPETAEATAATARRILSEYGETYAHEAGIRLRDTPAPLYRLLVLCVLLSVPIRAPSAVGAARELFACRLRTARRMADSRWQDRVDALGRAHYRRYDEYGHRAGRRSPLAAHPLEGRPAHAEGRGGR